MKAIVWREYRLLRPVLIAGAVVLLAPYGYLPIWLATAASRANVETITNNFAMAAICSLFVSQLTIAALGGPPSPANGPTGRRSLSPICRSRGCALDWQAGSRPRLDRLHLGDLSGRDVGSVDRLSDLSSGQPQQSGPAARLVSDRGHRMYLLCVGWLSPHCSQARPMQWEAGWPVPLLIYSCAWHGQRDRRQAAHRVADAIRICHAQLHRIVPSPFGRLSRRRLLAVPPPCGAVTGLAPQAHTTLAGVSCW